MTADYLPNDATTETLRPPTLPGLQAWIPAPRKARAEEVHKRDRRARLVGRWTQVGPTEFELSCRAPHQTSPWSGPEDGIGLLGFVEMFRQACILIAHQAYGVPDDEAFALSRLEVEVLAEVASENLGHDLDLRFVVDHVSYRGSRPAAIQASGTFLHHGRPVATFNGATGLMPHRVYRAVRRGAEPQDVSPGGPLLPAASVGLDRAADVLVRWGSEGDLLLAVDTGHAWHFDHPTDHVPGMTLLEAAIQARTVLTGLPRPRWLAVTFDRYAELAPEPELRRLEGRDGIEVRQDGTPVALVELRDGSPTPAAR